MHAFGGLVETGVGAGLTFSTGGIAGPLGWPIMAHGLDHYVTGMNTVWSGIPRDTVSSQLLQQAGMSPTTAGFVDNSISIVSNMGGTAILSISRTATYSLPTKTMGQITKNEINLISKTGNEGIILSRGAESANVAISLRSKLSGLQKAQNKSVQTRYLPDGRIRYYSIEIAASNPGLTRGGTNVVEWNPKTNSVRGWYECYDHSGNVNRVHPKSINGQKITSQHYPPIAQECK